MVKIIGIKLGKHADHPKNGENIYYYLALEDFEVGDTAIVFLPYGKQVCVPVVSVVESVDGTYNGIKPHKYAVGKVDNSKYKEARAAEKKKKELETAVRRAGNAVHLRINQITKSMGWKDWVGMDSQVEELVAEYRNAMRDYGVAYGFEDAARIDVDVRGRR